MREFVLQKQREQKDNFAKNIQSLIPEIGAVYPKMEEIRNEVNMCCAKVDYGEIAQKPYQVGKNVPALCFTLWETFMAYDVCKP